MKTITILIYLLFVSIFISAQNLYVNVFGGVANYWGDLQTKPFAIKQVGFLAGLGTTYEISDHIAVRGNINFGKISGDDKENKNTQFRNLNFSTNIIDFHLGVEYNVFSLDIKKFTPYAFLGVSFFNFNPYTFDPVGKKIYLQPLSTEGQGFYQNRKEYNLFQIALPFGGGFKYAINDNIRAGFEMGFRKTFTDYLDDVSATYIDQNLLFNNRGQQAVDLSFRSDEINAAATYPSDGTQRGQMKNKDWYYFSGLTLSFRINAGSGNKKGMGCPQTY